MSNPAKKLEIQIKSFLGSERAYWHGNSLRVPLPIELIEKLNITRRKGRIFKDPGEKMRFLFFETDKGILLKVVDEETEKRLKDILQFVDPSSLTDNDLKLLFG